MADSSDIILYRYSPENMPEEVLKKLFVGKEKLLKSLVKEIEKAAKKKTPRFYLIVGPRGIGKSHFLILLYFEIKKKLNSILIPIKLAEEEYSVFRTSDLFLRILEEKPEEISDILSLKEEDEILHAAVEKLKQISKKEDKRYIIFIENMHELFRQFDARELKKLRAIFQRNDIFSVVASAPMIFPAISDHNEPFYEFFRIQHLEEFSLDEIKILVLKIAEIENNKKFLEEFEKYEPKIRGMTHLTGGSPRLVILFYEIITKGELVNTEKAFFKIIDEHTPYYQEIFQLLTGQKRRIFDILISSTTPITPKQISKNARIDLPTVTTQLRRLEKDGYVISRPAGRHTYYEVRERLFRLWREMRQPFGRKRVSVLLEFLQLWYTPEERKDMFKAKFKLLEAGEKTVLRDLCYYAEILPLEFKTEALLKLTPKLLEFEEWEEAAYEIQKLKEIANQISDKELEGKIPLYEGHLLFSEEKYEEALEAFNKTLEINPKDEIVLLMKGLALEKLGRHDKTLKTLDKALKINPKNEIALSIKGFALGSLGRYEEALDAFNKALELDPKNEIALSIKGLALGSLDRHEEALKTFNKALKINPKNEIALSRKGFALGSLGRYEEALDAFNKALKINPKNEIALSIKGFALRSLGRYEEALDAFNKALELDPKNEIALSRKGLALVDLSRHEEALDAFNKALKINPKNEFALSRKGLALVYLGKHDEALEAFNKALEIYPKNEFALSRKGLALVDLDRYDEALEAFNKALEIYPKNEFALSRKGLALESLDRYEEALETFNKALEINLENEFALSRKGLALESLDRHEEALKTFNKALEINPENEFALLSRGLALGNIGRHEEALETFDKVLELNPKNENALLNKGVALLELKRYTKAVDLAKRMEDVATSESSKIDATLILIKAYVSLNRKTNAILEIEKIKSKIADQEPDSIENFIEICLNLALGELKAGNRGNGARFMEIAYNTAFKLKKEKVTELTITFLKEATVSGKLPVIKSAVDGILELQGDKYQEHIRPIIKAIEIVETRDIQKYYALQIEEREIVADIVRKIDHSNELLPAEIVKKESR